MIIVSYLALIRLLCAELGFPQIKRKYNNTIQCNTMQAWKCILGIGNFTYYAKF